MRENIHIIMVFLLIINKSMGQCPTIIANYEFGDVSQLTDWTILEGDGCNVNNCGWSNNELQYYSKNNVTIKEDQLYITALDESFGIGLYQSGALLLNHAINSKQGKIVIKALLPSDQGLFSGFYLFNDYGKSTFPVIDSSLSLVEYKNDKKDGFYNSVYEAGDPTVQNYFLSYDPDFFEGKHTYTLEWDDKMMYYSIDGYKYLETTKHKILSETFYIGIRMVIGGYEAGNINSKTEFPAYLIIDEVVIYDKADKVFIDGPRIVGQGEKDVEFEIQNLVNNAQYNWTLPAGIETYSIKEENLTSCWSDVGGKILIDCSDVCSNHHFEIYVKTEEKKVRSLILENFDSISLLVPAKITGELTDNVENPSQHSPNKSALCGKYVRNINKQYDVLFYKIIDFKNAEDLVTGNSLFYIDVLTNAPPGTLILLQLEDSKVANENNFPEGRYARFQSLTGPSNEWQRLVFNYKDILDENANPNDIDNIVLLFASDSYTDYTFYFDNFNLYSDYSKIVGTNDYIEELDQNLFYPNPCSNQLFIKGDVDLNEFKLLNIHGIEVKVNKGVKNLDMTNLPNGIYFLKHPYDNKYQCYKIIKN